MTDVALVQQHDQQLSQDIDYARMVQAASMLPPAYRGKPADIMLAVGLGRSMGLSPAESLLRIHVIQGRPTASAELIASNVRKAGHRLRVTGDETGARATITRADDADFEFESRWDLDRARRMDLINKDGWKKQPGTMMRWRAITEVARLACPEALYGVAYVADEIEGGREPSRASVVEPARDLTAQILGDDGDTHNPEEPVEATVIPDEPALITQAQTRALHASFGDAGISGREARLDYCTNLLGREIESSKELTRDEASRVIAALEADAQGEDGGAS